MADPDRLSQIRDAFKRDEVIRDMDVAWLIAEVKRLSSAARYYKRGKYKAEDGEDRLTIELARYREIAGRVSEEDAQNIRNLVVWFDLQDHQKRFGDDPGSEVQDDLSRMATILRDLRDMVRDERAEA